MNEKKILFLIIVLILIVPIIYSGGGDYLDYLSKGYADTLYCPIGGICTLDSLTVYDLYVIGEVFNVTVTNIYLNVTKLQGIRELIINTSNISAYFDNDKWYLSYSGIDKDTTINNCSIDLSCDPVTYDSELSTYLTNNTNANFNNLIVNNLQSNITNSSVYEDSSLVLHLQFNNNTLDSSQYKNDGSLENEANVNKDVLILDGVGGYVSLGSVGDLNDFTNSSGGGLTISAYIKVTTDKVNRIIQNRQVGFTEGFVFGTTSTADACTLDLALDGSFKTVVSDNSCWVLNEWVNVVTRWNTTHITIFRNGVEFATPVSATGQYTKSIHNTFIGKEVESAARYFNGSIACVKVWNRALGIEEINRETCNAVTNYGHFNSIETTTLNVSDESTFEGESNFNDDIHMPDSIKYYFGGADDVSCNFNGSDYVCTAEVGSPNYYWKGFSQVLGEDGTNSLPFYSFSDLRTMGMYRTGNNLGFVVGGQSIFLTSASLRGVTNERFEIDLTARSNTNPIYTFRGNTITGYGSAGDDVLSLITGGVERVNITNDTTTIKTNTKIIGNITVDTIFAKAINISNSSFSFTDNENNSVSYSVQNLNNGSNATSLITTLNDLGAVFGIGIASSNYILGSMLKPGITALFSRSRGEMLFINTFKQPFVWYNNPSDDDDLNNLVEKMRLNESGLNVPNNMTAENVFLPQFIFAHTNVTLAVIGANLWTNVTFDQETTTIKQGIGHTGTDGTNTTFTINADGIYDTSFNFDMIDTSASASNIDMAGRLIYTNGTEIDGSLFETTITKQQVETELSHEFLAELKIGDEIVFQFTADDADVEISTHGTFGSHPDSSSIVIKKIANIPE